MLEALKVIILGIVEGITEWLPISSTGHLILVEEFVKLNFSQSYLDMFNVVIQLGAIMAVVVIYFHRLNPFSPKKTEKQKKMTLQLWVKVVIASIPAGVVGILFNDFIEEKFNNSYVVATMLIVVGVLFIVIENRHKGRKPQITKISQMGVPVLIWIGVFQMLAMIPGTSRSGATIIGALALGVSRTAAADFYILSGDSGNGRCQPCKNFVTLDLTLQGLSLGFFCLDVLFHLLCPFWRSSFY